MKYTNIVQTVGFVISMAVLVGCSNEDPPSNSCIPGETAFCACAGGTEGVQTCAGDGTFGVCDCPDIGSDVSDVGEDTEPEVSEDPDVTDNDVAADPDAADAQVDVDAASDPDADDTDPDTAVDVVDVDSDDVDAQADILDVDTSDDPDVDVSDVNASDVDASDATDVSVDTDTSTTLGEACVSARDCSRGEFCGEDVCQLIEEFDCDGQSGVSCTDGGMMLCEDGVPTHHTPCGDESGTGGICVDNECQIVICASSVSEFYCTTLSHAEPCFSFTPPPAIDCEDGDICYDGECVPE